MSEDELDRKGIRQEPGERLQFALQPGSWNNITIPQAGATFEIEFASGTVIRGVQAAGQPLSMLPMEDVVRIEITIADLTPGPRLVRDEESN